MSDTEENISIEITEHNNTDNKKNEELEKENKEQEKQKIKNDTKNKVVDTNVLDKIGLDVLNKKTKKKVKLKIEKSLNNILSCENLSPITQKNKDDDCKNLEDLCGLHRKFEKVSYLEVKKINELYFDSSEYYSASMDILATYVRGQKILYGIEIL